MNNKHPYHYQDQAWKNILSSHFQEFVAFCWPKLYELIAWNKKPVFLEQELKAIKPSEQVGNLCTDKLVKIWFKNDPKSKWLLLHLEVHDKVKKNFSEHMFEYCCRIYIKHKRPIISCVVFIDPYLKNIPPPFIMENAGSKLIFEYNVINLLDYKNRIEDLQQSTNIFARVVLIQLKFWEIKRKNPQAKLDVKLMLARELLYSKYSKEQIRSLFYFLDMLVSLPTNLLIEYNKQIVKLEKEHNMGECMSSLETLGYNRGMTEGISKGVTKGITKGITHGIAQGVNQAQKQILKQLLEQKFTLLPKFYEEKLEQADQAVLLNWIKNILNANSLAEVFADT